MTEEDRPRIIASRAARVVVTVVRLVCGLAAAILAAHVVLTIGGANPDNGITTFVARWADRLALGFRDLFTPADESLRVLVNYGIAALFWLVVAAVVARVLHRFTSPYLIS